MIAAARDCRPDAVAGALLAMGQAHRVAALRRQPNRRPKWTGTRAAAHVLALATSGMLLALLGTMTLTAIIALVC